MSSQLGFHITCRKLLGEEGQPVMCMFCVYHSHKLDTRASTMKHTLSPKQKETVAFFSFHRRLLIMSEIK